MNRRDALWIVFGVVALITLAVAAALMIIHWTRFQSSNTTAAGQATGTSPYKSASNVEPPTASFKINHQRIQPTINGYQWSDGSRSSIGDAASDPARHLRKYTGVAGEKVRLQFSQAPKRINLTTWLNEKRVSQSTLTNSTVTLPMRAGDYTYEVTGHWGSDYVNYDFEVQVHS